MTAQKLLQLVKTPKYEYYPVPFWFWNGEMEHSEILFQINEMWDKGIKTYIIHARRGLTIEYLSEEWFCSVGVALKRAKELGMTVYIYDEDNWPSGYAGGKVVAENADYCGKHLRRLDITEDKCGRDILFENDKHMYVLENTSWCPVYSDYSYVDLFNKESTLCFIKHTHGEYLRRFAEYFGDVVVGFFVDEPGFYSNFELYESRPDAGTVQWTKGFAAYFFTKKNYDILQNLDHIFDDINENSCRIRSDYYDVAGQMYRENFLLTIKEWCEQNNVLSIGHLHVEEFLPYHVKTQGDMMKGIACLSMSGVDKIELFTEKLSEKYASSTEHIYSMGRTMSETYATSGWHFTLRDARRWANYQFVRGVNMIVIHAFYYSIEGDRKEECPPSLFYQNPYWQYFKLYSEYIARSTTLLTAGRHYAQIAVYYPIETQKCLVRPSDITEATHLDDLYIRFNCALLNSQLDFDIINSDVLDGFKSKDSLMIFNDAHYELLILACVKKLTLFEMENILRFARCGGKIMIACTDDFTCIDHREAQRFAEMYNEVKSFPTTFMYTDYYSMQNYLTYEISADNLRKTVIDIITPIVQIRAKNPSFKYICRDLGDAKLFFFCNESGNSICETISLDTSGRLYEIDLERCEISSIERNSKSFELSLDAYAGRFILVDEEEIKLVENSPALKNYRYINEQRLCDNFTITFEDGEVYTGEVAPFDKLDHSFYTGSAIYETVFEQCGEWDSVFVCIENFTDTAEVVLNEVKIKTLVWEPYICDITEHVKKGENKLKITVTNTLANNIYKKYFPSGLSKYVKVMSIKN